ncbi:hypothetical protein PbJCM13498_31010 [Prolixibacter bellariivorans]|uniref:Uncharacterized protein n=1 Tax=Prolixibacter bellariivorans TaxID=314319 RepID=A0A5M4B2U3_9BACT|nr:hypothetical protein PbJCM13498_31010 [Prolixibacter bellariivorans]
MNMYYYTFYWIYSIYRRLSDDEYFYYFAVGIYSAIVTCGIIGIVGIIDFVLLHLNILFRNGIILPGIYVGTYLFNYFLFIVNDRHIKQYSYYEKHRQNEKTLFAVVLIIVFIALCVTTLYITSLNYG